MCTKVSFYLLLARASLAVLAREASWSDFFDQGLAFSIKEGYSLWPSVWFPDKHTQGSERGRGHLLWPARSAEQTFGSTGWQTSPPGDPHTSLCCSQCSPSPSFPHGSFHRLDTWFHVEASVIQRGSECYQRSLSTFLLTIPTPMITNPEHRILTEGFNNTKACILPCIPLELAYIGSFTNVLPFSLKKEFNKTKHNGILLYKLDKNQAMPARVSFSNTFAFLSTFVYFFYPIVGSFCSFCSCLAAFTLQLQRKIQ